MLLLIASALLTSACDRRPDDAPVVVSVIGNTPRLADPARRRMSESERVLTGAIAQGLVRFDGTGQVEPGLAERWIVIDNGMSYIFRLREAVWNDGKPVGAAQVVTILKRAVAANSRSPLAPYLTAIDEIVVMTPTVIEVRLKRPRPDLLKLFAQPELAIARTSPPGGSGPFRLVQRARSGVLLRPADDLSLSDDDPARALKPADEVQLIGERASLAVARFAARKSDLVTGGTFLDRPLVSVAPIAPANFRVDPAVGLFGFAIVQRTGFLSDAENRAALASAFDRPRIADTVLSGAAAVDTLLPDQLDSAMAPTIPAWSGLALADRRASARQRVTSWRAGQQPPSLRMAMPVGPGATLLWAEVAATLMDIGITPVRVGPNDRSADLRLIDRIAPYDSARWYLNTACAPCSDAATTVLEQARVAGTLAERARAVALADREITADTPFIILARPLRWSLVALRLRGWQGNPRAWHPLNHLRNDPDRP